MDRHTPSWRPYIVLAAGLLAVSSASILIRFAQNEQASSLLISFWRVGIATIVLTPIVLNGYRSELAGLHRTDIALALLAGMMLAIHFASWITSLEYTSVLNSSVLVDTNALWVALASPFLLRERLSRMTILALIIAGAGAVIISAAGDAGTARYHDQPLLGNALALIGAICVAAYYMIGRRVRSKVSLIPYIWLTYGSSAIILLVIVLVRREQITGLPGNAYLWMTLIGLLPQLIGHSAYNYALGYLSAAYVSLTILGEPIGSTILATIFNNEYPKSWQLVGGVLILIALVIASRAEAQSTRQPEAKIPDQVAALTPE